MSGSNNIGPQMISGWRHKLISLGMMLYAAREVMIRYGIQVRTIQTISRLYSNFRKHKYALGRIVKNGSKYYVNLSVQGWPSVAYDRYVQHLVDHVEGGRNISLHSAIFAFTNACGFHCQHCVEWDNLNKADKLDVTDVLGILNRLHEAGVSQVLFSGGEPLSRYHDLLQILERAPRDMDYWVFTNGWKLDAEKANALKQKGLTGVLVSIDHFDARKHDKFRGMEGAFEKAVGAVRAARQASLLSAVTLVATNEFVTRENVMQYLEFARDLGADFVQFLEPEAEGRYRGLPVELEPEKQAVLEDIFKTVNTRKEFNSYPLITYYPYLKRTMGCAARGQHFLYIDANGDVHPCPFCRATTFSMLKGDAMAGIAAMRSTACSHGSRIGLILTAPEKKTQDELIRT